MTTENVTPAAATTPAAAVTTTPAATTPAAAVDTTTQGTLATTASDAAKTAETAAAATKEAERVAALSPEAKQAEIDAKAKSDDEATKQAEETRRAALTPEARKAEDEAKAEAEAKVKADAVPEKYELKLPDGLTVNEAVTTEFSAKAKELGLSQDKAQQLYAIGAKAVQAQGEAQRTEIAGAQASWLAASKGDKEFGGDKLTENLAFAARAMDFATPELRTLLNESKLGDHPEVIRWMVRVGKQQAEDAHRTGRESKNPAGTFEGKAKAFYPNMA